MMDGRDEGARLRILSSSPTLFFDLASGPIITRRTCRTACTNKEDSMMCRSLWVSLSLVVLVVGLFGCETAPSDPSRPRAGQDYQKQEETDRAMAEHWQSIHGVLRTTMTEVITGSYKGNPETRARLGQTIILAFSLHAWGIQTQRRIAGWRGYENAGRPYADGVATFAKGLQIQIDPQLLDGMKSIKQDDQYYAIANGLRRDIPNKLADNEKLAEAAVFHYSMARFDLAGNLDLLKLVLKVNEPSIAVDVKKSTKAIVSGMSHIGLMAGRSPREKKEENEELADFIKRTQREGRRVIEQRVRLGEILADNRIDSLQTDAAVSAFEKDLGAWWDDEVRDRVSRWP